MCPYPRLNDLLACDRFDKNQRWRNSWQPSKLGRPRASLPSLERNAQAPRAGPLTTLTHTVAVSAKRREQLGFLHTKLPPANEVSFHRRFASDCLELISHLAETLG